MVLNRIFSKDVYKWLKKYSISLIIRDRQIKANMRYLFTLGTRAGKFVEKGIMLVEMQVRQLLCKTV